MIFIVGGAYQGKEEYAKNKYADYEIVNAYHLQVLEDIKNGLEPEECVRSYLDKCVADGTDESLVIISNELGYGLVPVDRQEREYREKNGRVNCYLAECAKEVYRVVSGIAVRIK